MVKTLNEMVPFISQRLPNAKEILSLLCKQQADIMFLYDHFQKNAHETNEDAVEHLDGMKLTSFKKYGSQLADHLKQMSLIAAAGGHTTEVNMVLADMILMRVLELDGCRHSSRRTASEVLKQGLKHERPIWVLEAAQCLMRNYVLIGYEKIREFEDCEQIVQEYEPYLQLQNLSERLKLRHLANISRKKSVSLEYTQYLQEAEAQLSPHVGRVPSCLFHVNYYSIAYNLDFFSGKYQHAIQIQEQGIAYMNARPYDVNYQKSVFYMRIAYCYRMLREYNKAETNIQHALDLIPKGSFNWFTAYEVKFYIYLHQGLYDQATSAYQTATQHKNFPLLSADVQEKWYIIGAYLYIALRLAGEPLHHAFKPYKAAKFLNEINAYTFDKSGLYATARAAYLILMALEGKTDKTFDDLDAIDKYRRRYLNEGSTPRTDLFFKILFVMARHDFNPRYYRDKISEMMQELRDSQQDDAQYFEWEVIPYEWLLQSLLAQVNELGLKSQAIRMTA
jgi:tetratricopeptide (TPR) repeat protein